MIAALRRLLATVVKSQRFRQATMLLLLLTIILTLSALLAELVLSYSPQITKELDPNLPTVEGQIGLVVIVTICAFMVGMILFLVRAFTPKIHNFIYGAVGGSNTRIAYALPIIFALSLPLFVAMVYDTKTHLFSRLVEQYGVWLAVLGLLLSVVGSYFSASAMQDLRHVINTFEDFRVRFTAMVNDIIDDKDANNYIRIISYTPLPGALSLRGDGYEDLKDLLLHQDTRIELICLDEGSTKDWMQRFLGKKIRTGGRLSQTAIDEAVDELETLVSMLQDPHAQQKRRKFAKDHPVMRGRLDDLPKFYAYFTNERALVVNPLYNPIETLDAASQPEELTSRVVEIIGFETTDTYTLKNLHDIYGLVYNQIKQKMPAHPMTGTI